ncbi:MAG TPA: hypothetical protein VJH97_05485 [Candidatus Nanoarchaeia archaeon]|nr:hypothetical protein [Candidatus Nanoarchaeia archaeon]
MKKQIFKSTDIDDVCEVNQMDSKTCGMWVCKKCGYVNIIFGLLLLIASFWKGAPGWLTPWALIGLYLLLWGIMSAMGKQH